MYKVSGTGWLCYQKVNGEWVPLFKLTSDQIQEWNDFHQSRGETRNVTSDHNEARQARFDHDHHP